MNVMEIDLTVNEVVLALAVVNAVALLLTLATSRIVVRVRLRRHARRRSAERAGFAAALHEVGAVASHATAGGNGLDVVLDEPDSNPDPVDEAPRGEIRLAADLLQWRSRYREQAAPPRLARIRNSAKEVRQQEEPHRWVEVS